MNNIILSNDARKYLKKLDAKEREIILKKIKLLKEDFFPSDFKKIIGVSNLYRIRSGKYRILYSIFKEELEILIVDIDKRSKIYRGL